ncbi:MAG TPA: hypothetical protein VFT64_05965 [Rickettsiales bacterium]|nr:hypothetical protein [Rickettsiales bacterium]
MSDEDPRKELYGDNIQGIAPWQNISGGSDSYAAAHDFRPAEPYVGDPRMGGNAPYASAPYRAPRPRRSWKQRGQSFLEWLLTLVFLGVVAIIGSINIWAGVVAFVAWIVIAAIIRQRVRKGRK